MSGILKAWCYILIAGVLVLPGCQVEGKGSLNLDKKDVTQRDLYGMARAHRKILLVDAWKDPAYQRKLRELVKDVYLGSWELMIKNHRDVTAEDIANAPTMLIGTPSENLWINELMPGFPFKINPSNISIEDHTYESNNHSLVLSHYPNPLNINMPVGVFTSYNESLIWNLVNSRISSFFGGDWNYEVLKDGRRILLGNLSQKADTRWEIDPTRQINLPVDVVNTWASEPFVFNSFDKGLNANTMHYLTEECRREVIQIQQTLGRSLPNSPIHYYLYPSTEIKGLMTGNTDQSHLNVDRNEVHSAFDGHFKGRYFGKENQLLIKKLLGSPSFEALEVGLFVYFSSQWEGKGYQYWAKHLITGNNGIPVMQLLDSDQFRSSSKLIRECLAGSLTRFLIEHWGAELFLDRYKDWQPHAKELLKLNEAWWSSVRRSDVDVSPVVRKELPFLQGFNFTHEGYQIYNGYGSNMSEESLAKVRELGANAVAVVPFGWMRDPNTPSRFRFSNRAGSEHDEGVIHTLSKARQLGLFTMLKPHVWISGGWPGEVKMTSDSNWELFFDNYFQWISHYALIAEMYQVDVLCIGVEFSKATLEQEDHWRELIKKIRKIYRGNLTYAANWGNEFENITFWDQLDFIGLNCYYPIANQIDPTDQQLKEGFNQTLIKIAEVKSRFEKPLLLTEIGFRSVETPWLQPHEEAGERSYSEEEQARSYSAVFEAMEVNPVVDGILWWKWPTNMEFRKEEDRRFVPTGKKAERVIEKWYKKQFKK